MEAKTELHDPSEVVTGPGDRRKRMQRSGTKMKHRSVQNVSQRHGAHRRPFARVRSGIRTGTTAHFAAWMSDLRAKSALQRLTTLSIALYHDDASVAAGYAIAHGGGVKTVWDLSRRSEAELLAIKGMGPKRLIAIRDDLNRRSVRVDW
jgi:hypothetical protein